MAEPVVRHCVGFGSLVILGIPNGTAFDYPVGGEGEQLDWSVCVRNNLKSRHIGFVAPPHYHCNSHHGRLHGNSPSSFFPDLLAGSSDVVVSSWALVEE